MNTVEKIKQQIYGQTVLLYMKGTPQFPMCGFSAHVTNALNKLGAQYTYVNVLTNPDIRQELPKYAKWPTFPQLYVQGKLIGGCDIIMDMYQHDELKILLEKIHVIDTLPSFQEL